MNARERENDLVPEALRRLLVRSDLEGPLLTCVAAYRTILEDNQLEFFPGYTNHGIRHISRLLKYEIALIPEAVWEHDLLGAEDAFVIIVGTLLHDIAMHLRWGGLRHLLESTGGNWHAPGLGDRTWCDEWGQFCEEACRWDGAMIARVFGPDAATTTEQTCRPWQTVSKVTDLLQNDTHRLFIGEFVRRWHPRIAHQIAMSGFPGAADAFPSLLKMLPVNRSDLADLTGIVARSHGMNLRVAMRYVTDYFPHTRRPLGAVPAFAMALLRVADYLDLEGNRAPRSLLRLRQPPSRMSVQEWQNHDAIAAVGFDGNEDAGSIQIQVHRPNPPHRHPHAIETHLLLRRLFASIQHELDHSAAVLAEQYSQFASERLNLLQLKKSRLLTNLDSPALHAALPYIPREAAVKCHAQLGLLLGEPLYAGVPEYGLRELMQNAIDAVRERVSVQSSVHMDRSPDEAEVVVEIIEQGDQAWLLRVSDRGIGMTVDTIIDYFLHAGASFRDSVEWRKRHFDEQSRPRLARAGYFGIGVLAAFLLGDELRVRTRHMEGVETLGFTVRRDRSAVEIQRLPDAATGTVIEISLDKAVATSLLRFGGERWDWFVLPAPTLERRVKRLDGTIQRFHRDRTDPGLDCADATPLFRRLDVASMGTVYWSSIRKRMSVNGFRIGPVPTHGEPRDDTVKIEWKDAWLKKNIEPVGIAVHDYTRSMPLNLRRDGLTRAPLPFLKDLEPDVLLDILAFMLTFAPRRPIGRSANRHWAYSPMYPANSCPIGWFSTPNGCAPLDAFCHLGANGIRLICEMQENPQPDKSSFRAPGFRFRDNEFAAIPIAELHFRGVPDYNTIFQFLPIMEKSGLEFGLELVRWALIIPSDISQKKLWEDAAESIGANIKREKLYPDYVMLSHGWSSFPAICTDILRRFAALRKMPSSKAGIFIADTKRAATEEADRSSFAKAWHDAIQGRQLWTRALERALSLGVSLQESKYTSGSEWEGFCNAEEFAGSFESWRSKRRTRE